MPPASTELGRELISGNGLFVGNAVNRFSANGPVTPSRAGPVIERTGPAPISTIERRVAFPPLVFDLDVLDEHRIGVGVEIQMKACDDFTERGPILRQWTRLMRG